MKIALVKSAGFGDILHAAYSLQVLKAMDENAEITWIASDKDSCFSALEGLIGIDRQIILPLRDRSFFNLARYFKAARLLQAHEFDLVFDLQHELRNAFFAYLAGKSGHIFSSLKAQVWGFDKNCTWSKCASCFYSHKLALELLNSYTREHKLKEVSYFHNRIYRSLALVHRAFGRDFGEYEFRAFMASKKPLYEIENAKREDFIILQIGSSGMAKVLDLEKLKQLLRSLEELSLPVVLTAASNVEFERAKALQSEFGCLQIAQTATWHELVRLVSSSALLIGFDTGPSHIALAQNVPSILLYGPTPAKLFTWQTPINKALQLDESFSNFSARETVDLASTLL